MPNETLYILMRNDMASMNAGKAMAQASHASNAFVKNANAKINTMWGDINLHNAVQSWQNETNQGFGTVLVLAVNELQMYTAVQIMQDTGHIADVVHDPTYPLVDGDFVHFLPIDTCAYVFVQDRNNDDIARAVLGKFGLHP